jgi:hypothetical protein
MRPTTLIFVALACLVAALDTACAHGDEPHPKCNKGYVVSDTHKCVKAPA